MMLLFNGIFSTISVTRTDKQGFLQVALAVLSARAGIVIGKVFVQLDLPGSRSMWSLPFVWRHWPVSIWQRHTGLVDPRCCFYGNGLHLIGMMMAWRLRISSAYHALMSALLLPGWKRSGAVFPLPAGSPLGTVLRMNLFAWMVDLTCSAVYGSELPEGLEDIMLSVPQALGYLSVLS